MAHAKLNYFEKIVVIQWLEKSLQFVPRCCVK